jgi:hypothetical protein
MALLMLDASNRVKFSISVASLLTQASDASKVVSKSGGGNGNRTRV